MHIEGKNVFLIGVDELIVPFIFSKRIIDMNKIYDIDEVLFKIFSASIIIFYNILQILF